MNASTCLGSFLDQRQIQYTTKGACSTSSREDHDIQSCSGAELRLFFVGISHLGLRRRLIDERFGFPGDAQFLRMPVKHSIQQMANDQATDKATTQSKQCMFKYGHHKIARGHPCNQRNQESGQAGDGSNKQVKPWGSHHYRNRPEGRFLSMFSCGLQDQVGLGGAYDLDVSIRASLWKNPDFSQVTSGAGTCG